MLYNYSLDTFISVVELGSFSKAADELNISAPAVIKQINLLELNVGVKLFIRSFRGIEVTDAGKSLYKDAKYIIEYSRKAENKAKEISGELSNVIRIGISPLTPPNIFTELWPKINEKYPDMRFELITFENSKESARELAILGENMDVIAGVFDEKMLKLRKCNGICLSLEPLCIGVSVNNKLFNKKKLNIDDLNGETLLIAEKEWSINMDRLRSDLIKNYKEIKIKDIDNYNISLFNRCEKNNELFVGIKMWENVHPLIHFIPVNWEYNIPYGLLYSKHHTTKVKKIINVIKNIKNSYN